MTKPKRGARALVTVGAVCSLLLTGCDDLPSFFDGGVERVVVEVDYVPGAEPITGAVASIDDVWKVAEANARAVLGDDKEYVFPHRLEQMSMISVAPATDVTKEDILEIAERHRDEEDTSGTRTIYIVWLDSFLVSEGERREDVLAVSIDDTRVIGVLRRAFPKMLRSVPEDVRDLAEQAVLVHELGHAFGLVDRGIPREESDVLLAYEYRGTHHCHNAACVMYKGAAASHLGLIEDPTSERDLVMFGEECLTDARRARD